MSEEEKSQSVFNLVMRFFTIPLMIVAVCIAVFYLFGRIAYEKKGIDDYLTEIKTGSASRRWQAAYELSKRINREEVKKNQGEMIARELTQIYRREKDAEDPRLRRYLVLSLSGMSRPETFSLFEEALTDPDPDVRIYALWGLGGLKDPAALKILIPYMEDKDAAFRKTAAYSLGFIGDRRAITPLKKGLKDDVFDVQWNAALALARLNDPSGLEVLHKMLDRSYLDRISTLNETQKLEVMANALKGILLLKDKTALPFLTRLIETESHPEFREQVRKTIDTLQ